MSLAYPPVDEAGSPARRVLVVDDDELNRKLAVLRLRDAGFEAEACATAEGALDVARSAPAAAIVSDVHMPAMDGFELCRAVRAERNIGQIPFVLMSSVVEETDRKRGRQAGADVVLSRTPDLWDVIDFLATRMGVLRPRRR